ncbi:MAG TPA: cyclopropane-fatty-acyl-phospholipid synthase family protein [Steroidobacteraceae bacterium]|jgi:cyclopropane-fatty-acyl-phospholipid synthase|nr:cyclopropane-fatty-acyl-phospholipid synthase family protein [Steroidobacteraceae bacterium]
MQNQTHTDSAMGAASAAGTRMSVQALQEPSPSTYRGSELASDLLKRLFDRLPFSITLRLWNGAAVQVGAIESGPQDSRFTLVFRNPEVVCATVLGRDPLRLAEAYFRGDLDIEGDFFAALQLKDHLQALQLSVGEQIGVAATALRLRALNAEKRPARLRWAPSHGRAVKAHSKSENRDAVQFHYDVSNEFYALWLDRAMVYSCAYFEKPEIDLDAAQEAKLDHICRKLLLHPGEEFLDIGCGWGALVIHAARRFGVRAHGVTLSPQQLKVAQERIAEAGLGDRVRVELRDYRDLPAEPVYDKVASVGMFEHVGLKNLPVYFSTVHRLLKPHGLFLNHGITHDSDGWQKSLSTEFINRYVFPDGQLDNISNIQQVMERARFEIADVEALRPHYALTLRHWVGRLEHNHARALQYVNEATFRVWRLYMAACALEFEAGGVGIYQVLASKRAEGSLPLPLTRRYMYS